MIVSELKKGSISFRVGKGSVAIVVACYKMPHKVIGNFSFAEIDSGSAASDISALLACYKNGQAKWDKFFAEKLKYERRQRAEKDREMTLEQIKVVMADVAWSLDRHRKEHKAGSKHAKETASSIWKSWQIIRNVIASSWGVTEAAAKNSNP